MAIASVIGQSSVVRGHVRGEGSIEILGRVEGDVTVNGDVTLGEHAAVRGSVTGAQIVVGGTVAGDIRGREAVLLERSARVVGDLNAPRIGIADGALVRGSVQTDGEAMPTGMRPARAREIESPRAATPARGRPASRPVTRARAAAPIATDVPAAAPTAKASVSRATPTSGERAGSDAAQKARASATTGARGTTSGRQPPPPIVPLLRKGARGRKKKARQR